jgi:hypothetical protein
MLFNITMKILLKDTQPDMENDITYFLFQNQYSLVYDRTIYFSIHKTITATKPT